MNFSPGDIVFFDVLHIDVAEKLGEHKNDEGQDCATYSVPGKKRRMLVLAQCGESWYLLLKITAKKPTRGESIALPDGNGLTKESFLQTSDIFKYPLKLAGAKKGNVGPLILKYIQSHAGKGPRMLIEGTPANWPL